MRKLLNDRQWKFLYELHCYGYTYKELSAWLGFSPNTVQYNFYRLGFKSFEREPLSEYNNQLAALGGGNHVRRISN